MRTPESPEVTAIKVRYYKAKAKLAELQRTDDWGTKFMRANTHFLKVVNELRQRRSVELREDRATAGAKK